MMIQQGLYNCPSEMLTSLCAPGPPRSCYISASALHWHWDTAPKGDFESSLFFFGSKRSWIFPNTPEEEADAFKQPTDYAKFHSDFKALILAKEARGEVCFLKDASEGGLARFHRVSAWFESLGYPPLCLDEAYWKGLPREKLFYASSTRRVISNFTEGSHEYDETMELIRHSYSDRIIPRLTPLV